MKKIFFFSFMFFKVMTVQSQQKTIVSHTGEKISVNADATTSTKGLIQLAGDLAGTAVAPLVKDGAISDSKIAGPVGVAKGGTGQSSFTNGQLLIGNSTGSTLTKSNLTGTTNQISVTNGPGSITLALPQNIATTSDVTFRSLSLTSTGPSIPAITFLPDSYFSIKENGINTQFILPKSITNSTYITYPLGGDFFVRNAEDLNTDNFSFKIDKNGAMTLRNVAGNTSTPPNTDNSTRVATTAFVKNALLNGTGIYAGSGALSTNTVVNQGNNTLNFNTSVINGFSVNSALSVNGVSNRVGIGTSDTAPGKLVVESVDDSQLAVVKSNVATGFVGITGNAVESLFAIASDGSDIVFKTGSTGGGLTSGSERLRIDSATGNIGINNSNPTAGNIHIKGDERPQIVIEHIGQGAGFIGQDFSKFVMSCDGAGSLSFKTNSNFTNGIQNGDERILVGGKNNDKIILGDVTSSTSANSTAMVNLISNDTKPALTLAVDPVNGGSISFMDFRTKSGLNRGTISYGTNGLAFFNTSDYRLKKDLKSFDAMALFNQIPIYDFAWKNNDSRSYGVMAHELQKVLPFAVTGKKDGVNPDGTMDIQTVAYGTLMPIVIKATQELDKKIIELQTINTDLEQRVAALEKAVHELQLLIKK